MWSRRAFLKAGGLSLFTAGLGGLAPSFLARAARAAPAPGASGRRKVLVTLFQRGAMDGLAAVPLLAEERMLRQLRPRLTLSGARSAGDQAALDLDGRFGLHPAFGDLASLYRDGRLAVVHAVGSPDPTRSHFDAQDYMETGTPGRKGTSSGWLNRVVGELGHEASPWQAVALTATLPRSLSGAQSAVAVTDLADFKLQLRGADRATARAGAGFEALYQETSQELLRETGRETFEAMRLLSDEELRSYRPARGANYPRGPLGSALTQIAMLVKMDVGLEVAFAETGGWDTHVQQGGASGTFARRAQDLSRSLAAFWTDLGGRRDDVVVMTMTEFGRTVRENGSGGTDHGHGSCLFLLGQEVAGGRVHGHLESLHPDALYEGRDLPVTTDFRAVFAEVAGRHLGAREPAALFPGWQGGRVGLFQG